MIKSLEVSHQFLGLSTKKKPNLMIHRSKRLFFLWQTSKNYQLRTVITPLIITHKIGVQFLVELDILICPFTTKQMSLQREIGFLEPRILSIKITLTLINHKSTKCSPALQPKISKSKIGKSFKLIFDVFLVLLFYQ